jgi:hypothetical protein
MIPVNGSSFGRAGDRLRIYPWAEAKTRCVLAEGAFGSAFRLRAIVVNYT